MAQVRRRFTAGEKVRILRQHLVEKEAVSDVCDADGLDPTVFYRWQKEFFENGEAAFQRRSNGRERKLQEQNAALRAKLAQKDSHTMLELVAIVNLVQYPA